MTTTTELTPLLKRLKLGAVLNTLPERVALARRDQIDYASFLQIILTDEINRRDHRRLELRLQRAGFEQTCRLEDFDWSASITLDRRLLVAAFSLQFLDRNEHVLLVGPVGVGKSFIAQALGYAAVRAGHTVRFVHADDFFRTMAQARVDHSTDKTFRSFIAPDLLILDDLGLHRMTQQQSIDLYELVIARHRTASFVITSNRAVDEWLGLFDDSILGNSALDRLANASYQIVIEGASYRERLSPHRALLDRKEAQIPHLEKKKTSLEPAVKRAKMFLGREKRSPTRCTYYEARGSAVPVRAGEELAGHDGDGGHDDVLGVDARSRFEVVGRAPRGTAGVWSGLDGQPSGQLADTAEPGRR